MHKAILESYKRAFTGLKELGYKQYTKSVKPPLLEDVLKRQLLNRKSFMYRGKEYSFSSYSTDRAFMKLKYAVASDYNGIYELLQNGITISETIDKNKINSSIHYIDWENFNNNQFHIIKEYQFQTGAQKVILDMVLFVNGIPLVILDFSLIGSIVLFKKLQLLNDTLKDRNTPVSFAQLLISVSPERVEYNTTNAKDKQWPVWQGDGWNSLEQRQDMILAELCAPANLLRLIKNYILVGNDTKRIAWWHQRRAVERTIERVRTYDHNGSRKGGVLWHATGSGVNVTMALLIQNILHQPDILHPRIIVVSDRTATNAQIQNVLSLYRLNASEATTVNTLLKLLDSDSLIITTVINKFHHISEEEVDRNNSELFVLINKSFGRHMGAYFYNLRMLFPKACYIGFTNALFSGWKDVYGSDQLIDMHSISDNVANDVTVPVNYDGRIVCVSAEERFSEIEELSGSWKRARQTFDEARVDVIADDIATHFYKHNKGTPFKAILVTASRSIAQKYKKCFDKLKNGPNYIRAALLVSKEDLINNSAFDVSYSEGKSEEEYYSDVIQKLQSPSNELEILIICKHQLTGIDTYLFNTLYIAKYMQPNMLLHYVSRINGKVKNKFNCLVVDYAGVEESFQIATDGWRDLTPAHSGPDKLDAHHHQTLRLKNGLIVLDQLREFIKNPVTDQRVLNSLISKKEIEELYLEKLYECEAMLLNVRKDAKEFEERLSIHKNVAEEIKINQETQSGISVNNQMPELPVDAQLASMFRNDGLAILFYQLFKDIIIKKQIGVGDENLTSFCIQWSDKFRSITVRNWSSKVIRDVTNSLEDSLVTFCNENDIEFGFSDIDDLIGGVLTTVKNRVPD